MATYKLACWRNTNFTTGAGSGGLDRPDNPASSRQHPPLCTWSSTSPWGPIFNFRLAYPSHNLTLLAYICVFLDLSRNISTWQLPIFASAAVSLLADVRCYDGTRIIVCSTPLIPNDTGRRYNNSIDSVILVISIAYTCINSTTRATTVVVVRGFDSGC